MPQGEPGAPSANLASIAARVDRRLEALLAGESDRWARLDPDVKAPLDELLALVLSGGKRLRPAFVHWGHVGAGGDPASGVVVDGGAAFEMLHTFALVHDDVVDDSAVRRGRPTFHRVFEDEHEEQAYRGEGRRYGEGVAVLMGDLAHVYADVLATAFPASALAIWNELRIELNIGQFLDLLGTARGDTDLSGAERIARYKSAKYTIERPLHLGAALAGRLDELHDVYTAYGVPLGDAFQLRDDVLGVFGDATVIGKPVGDDLREGKPTPLLALAHEHASVAQREVLNLVGSRDLTPEDVASCQQVIVDTGALDAIEARIRECRDAALRVLGETMLAGGANDALGELAYYVTVRDR